MSEHLNLGGEIQSARTAAGYSLTDIEKITRIPSFILSDIEKNKFSTSGGSTYARGHIRTLAKLLNLNSSDLIAKFEEITKSRTPLGLPIELPGSGAKFKSLTRGSESASEVEISLNSRAQSMRLRAIEKVAA